LRREYSNAVTEVSRRKQALAKRPQAAVLMSQAQALLAELGVEADLL
jgi:hypothetical protein